MCKWFSTYCWKALNEGYNFALDLITIKGLHTKLWVPQSWDSKVAGVPTLGIPGPPLGNPKTKCVLWPVIEYIIRGKVVASPKSGPWWVLWIRVSSWNSSTSFYPQSAMSEGECPNSLLFCCFHFIRTLESIKELGSALVDICLFFRGANFSQPLLSIIPSHLITPLTYLFY